MRLLIELRDTTRELIQAQLEDMPDEVITELQAKLNRQYDYYHSKFGLINSRGASLDMRDDSGYFLLCSLENLDSEGNFIGKSDMFFKAHHPRCPPCRACGNRQRGAGAECR